MKPGHAGCFTLDVRFPSRVWCVRESMVLLIVLTYFTFVRLQFRFIDLGVAGFQ